MDPWIRAADADRAFRVDGMHCGSCALVIDDTLADLPDVRDTRTNVKEGRGAVEPDLGQASPQDVVAAITELGYRATPVTDLVAC